MTPILRTMLLVLTACFLCLPATGFACKVQKQPAQQDCCAKEQVEHWCENGQAQQHTGKNCSGACSDCCCQHLTEYTVLPVTVGVKLLPRSGRAATQALYAEEYSFTNLQLIWTPPKSGARYLWG